MSGTNATRVHCDLQPCWRTHTHTHCKRDFQHLMKLPMHCAMQTLPPTRCTNHIMLAGGLFPETPLKPKTATYGTCVGSSTISSQYTTESDTSRAMSCARCACKRGAAARIQTPQVIRTLARRLPEIHMCTPTKKTRLRCPPYRPMRRSTAVPWTVTVDHLCYMSYQCDFRWPPRPPPRIRPSSPDASPSHT